MSKRITGSQKQKHTKRCVNPHDHQRVIGVTSVPCPTGWPDGHQQIDANDECDTNQYQRNAKVFKTNRLIHSVPLFSDGLVAVGSAVEQS